MVSASMHSFYLFFTELSLQLKDTTKCIKAVDATTIIVEEMIKQGLPFVGTIQNDGISIIVIFRSQVMHLQIQ
jgi:hypothetical protein